MITDAHRQNVKVPKFGRPLPIIFKLGSLIDKKVIYDNLKNLALYNATLDKGKKVFVVMEHLPEEMQADRKSLLTVHKEAKQTTPNLKRSWFADRDTGEYCLRVGDVVHRPKRV